MERAYNQARLQQVSKLEYAVNTGANDTRMPAALGKVIQPHWQMNKLNE